MIGFLRKADNILYTFLFLIIWTQYVLYLINEGVLSLALTIGLMGALVFVIYRTREKEQVLQKPWRLFVLAQIPGVLVMLTALFTNHIELSWDWGTCINAAYQLVTEGSTDRMVYIARYSNNRLWLAVLIWLFRAVRWILPEAQLQTYIFVSMILGDIMCLLSVDLTYAAAVKLLSPGRALAAGCMTALYMPVWLYAQFAYTDTVGIFFCSLVLFLYGCLKSKTGGKKAVSVFLLGMVSCLSFKLKVLIFIPVIAAIIEALLGMHAAAVKRYLYYTVLAAAGFAVMHMVSGVFISSVLTVPEEFAEEYEFPPEHWIMMALRGEGGFYQEDVDYTAGYSGYEAKKAADREEIKKRLQSMSAAELASHLLHHKMTYTWCNPMLRADDYAFRESDGKGILYHLFSVNSEAPRISLLIAKVYYACILLGLLLSGLLSVRRSEDDPGFGFWGRTALVGFVLFEMIWECNSRYLYCLLPVIMVTAEDGFYRLREAAKRTGTAKDRFAL